MSNYGNMEDKKKVIFVFHINFQTRARNLFLF